jgi:nucleolar protein 16
MGRELQKKKKRSSIPKIKLKPKSKKVNPLGNAIIAANWNQKETLTQNYKRLGLTSRLNSATGGTEKLKAGTESKTSTSSKLAITNAIPKTIAPTEARVERDETGKIIRVIHSKSRPNPLNDPLNSESEDEEMADDGEEFEGFDGEKTEENEIVKQLEEQASMGAPPTERKQSDREKEWIERLVAKYGEDYGKMARDMRLNPMQQTPADIKRRVGKWKTKGGAVSVET